MQALFVFLFLFFFGITCFILLLVRKSNIKKRNIYEEYYSLRRFKYNPSVFRELNAKGRKFGAEIFETDFIYNPGEVYFTLTVICKLNCKPCVEAYSYINNLVNRNVKVKIIVRFFCQDLDINSRDFETLKSMYESRSTISSKKIFNVIEGWYSSQNSSSVIAHNDIKDDINSNKEFYSKMEKPISWFGFNRIPYTPYFIVDGYPLHDAYSYKELHVILEKMEFD